MSGTLTHSPADVLRRLLISLSQGANPTGAVTDSWPIYVSREPDKPDSCITLVDYGIDKQGRFMVSGEVQEQYLIQIRVRDARYEDGWPKANAIAQTLDKTIRLNTITIDSTTYLVSSVSRLTGPLAIGRDLESNREVFTINCKACIRQTS